jgi:FdhD protein
MPNLSADSTTVPSPATPPRPALTTVSVEGGRVTSGRAIAQEVAVAIELDGVGFAVMMATPYDLEDFVVGLLLAEGEIAGTGDLSSIDVAALDIGMIVRVDRLHPDPVAVMERMRPRTTDSACGLCGRDSLDRALMPLPQVTAQSHANAAALFAAAAALRDHQPLNRATGAVHAAALAAPDGTILLVREDVGRHNAFDKLIGAMARGRIGWDGGFALLSSRCSFELVDKAVRADCPLLATISAPTSLALERAAAAGLTLATLVRSDTMTLQLCPASAPELVA